MRRGRSRWARRRVIALALIGFVLATAVPSAAAADARAVGRWSMVPQSKDADRDGIIDGDGGVPRRGALSLQPSPTLVGAGNRVAQPQERLIGGALSWYLSPRGFPVRLDACRSTGDRYRWRISVGGQSRTLPWLPLTPAACTRTILLPEGPHALDLEVRSGGASDRSTLTADVRNILVVALGDSYASGEGNPRNVAAWVRSGSAAFSPYWDDAACHRSARGAPAQAALLLEDSSPQTSVTLVDVTCSGATVNAGVLGPQPSAGVAASQVEQARAIVGEWPVDVVTLSVGGNDVGFTSVLESCALTIDCPLQRAASAPLDAYPRLQDGVQALTGALPAAYRRVAACLTGTTCTLAGGRSVTGLAATRVLPTLYPDITRAADGQPCSYFTIDSADFAWARSTILSPSPVNPYAYPLARGGSASLSVAQGSLNQQLAATASLPGWQPVAGTWTASADTPTGHGVCAGSQAWAFGATLLSSLPSASFHPNITGQRVLATALAQALRAATTR